MDHLVVPLDRDHTRALEQLRAALVADVGLVDAGLPRPHVTLVAYTELEPAQARAAVAETVEHADPFTVRAHGYGFFAGDQPSALALHVPVVRSPELDGFHHDLVGALRAAGADVAGWTDVGTWTPHITLIDRTLDPGALGRAVEWLARRHHPAWTIPVDRVAIVGGWGQGHREPEVVHCGRAGPNDDEEATG